MCYVFSAQINSGLVQKVQYSAVKLPLLYCLSKKKPWRPTLMMADLVNPWEESIQQDAIVELDEPQTNIIGSTFLMCATVRSSQGAIDSPDFGCGHFGHP
jgi:hypothetical protein